MAEKRKTQDPVRELLLKKQKMAQIPISSHTINKVLPLLSNTTFDSYMINTGPKLWKDSIKTLSLEDAKKLFLLIVRRKDTLAQAIAVYFTLWGEEPFPPRHLYDLGFGGYFRQTLLPGQEDYLYMYLYNRVGFLNHVYPILPELRHNQHYFCLNKNFEKKGVCGGEKQVRIDPAILTPKQNYYKLIISALSCQKLERWSECFAYSLSALDIYNDDYEKQCSHLDDLLCFIAQSGSKMSVPLQWSCNVLEEARRVGTFCDQTWKRILVFQQILIDNGLFDLEKEVFVECEPIFSKHTMFYQELLEHHILAMLEQVENNLAFQFVRQKFHDDCEEFCEKSPCLKQSFGITAGILFNMDGLTQKLTTKGLKEYFRGYFYLYSTMLVVYKKKIDEKTQSEMNLARQFFLLAREQMNKHCVFYKDLDMVTSFLKKVPLTLDIIAKHFSKNAYEKNTTGVSHFLFRAMLITMYWDNIFQPIPLMDIVTSAREMNVKVTNGYGYRGPLLTSCLKILDVTFFHKKDNDIDDYPMLCITPEKKSTLDEAIQYWQKEKADEFFNSVQYVEPNCQKEIEKKVLNSEIILQKNKLAEQVYAFGYQIVEARTNPTH